MFFKYLKMDFYKLCRSKIIWMHIIIPIVTIISFLGYFKISKATEIAKLSAYISVVCVAFPFIIAIVMGLMYEQEQEAGFQNFLNCTTNKYVPHISKFLVIIFLGFISTLITILGFGVFWTSSFSLDIYFKLTLIVFLSSIISYIIQYLLVLYLGKGVNIGIGIIGVLIAALMNTGLGDGKWMFIPWDYGIRIANYFLLGINKATFPKSLYISIVIYIIVLVVFGAILIQRWEGRKTDD